MHRHQQEAEDLDHLRGDVIVLRDDGHDAHESDGRE